MQLFDSNFSTEYRVISFEYFDSKINSEKYKNNIKSELPFVLVCSQISITLDRLRRKS